MLFVLLVLVLCYLLSFLAKTGTAAWFVSETEAKGSLVNAVTEDLISVSSTQVSCENGQAQVKVTITNLYEIELPIQLQEIRHYLLPGETLSEVITTPNSGLVNEIQIPLSVFNHYIEEMIEIPINCESNEELLELEEEDAMETGYRNNDSDDETHTQHENE